MIRYEQGDMFEYPADIRVNTVNCVGVMGAGVALAFKTRYPSMFKAYAKACKAGLVRPGKPFVWEKQEFDESVTIVNFPTKDHWREPSEYKYIEKGLHWLRDFLAKRGKVRVAIPALGAGHGGLNWERVRPMIVQSLGDLKADIIVFNPSSSHEAGERVDRQIMDQLEGHGIRTLRPGDPDYPEKLRGRSDANVYVRGDLGLLAGPVVAVLPSIKPAERETQGLVACVREFAHSGMCILTGYSPMADRPVIRAALEQGASVIICLVEGILEFKVRKDLQDVWDERRVTVISTSKPTERWFAGGVGKTTAIKLALSDAILLSDPDPEWLRTFSRNRQSTIRSRLFYLDYGKPRDGIAAMFRQLQATGISRNRNTGKPNVSELVAHLNAIRLPPCSVHLAAALEEDKGTKLNVPIPKIQESEASVSYPKRLIEVDLPIKRISAHARKEKSIRHGHISTLHLWWARRPLAACRAVICASLWPDPADEHCPNVFRKTAKMQMLGWTSLERQNLLSAESRVRFEVARKDAKHFDDPVELRKALLDFIADFSNWDNSTEENYLDTSHALTQAAHEGLGGAVGAHPLVVDPFAGGGSIPFEALRVGADAFASDLNPVPVLLNKVVLEYIPKYGQQLADEVRKWGEWIKKEAEKELSEFYPQDKDGATPIAYLWARTIQCEGPGCGAQVPLIRSLWLAKKSNRSVALQFVPRPRAKRVDFKIIMKQPSGWVNQGDATERIVNPNFDGTVKRGSASCPCCGYTTPVARVREQLKKRHGGANDARLLAVVTLPRGKDTRVFRLSTVNDEKAVRASDFELARREKAYRGAVKLVPDETLPLMSGVFNAPIYGMNLWGDLFTRRQLLALNSFAALVVRATRQLTVGKNAQFAQAVQSILGLGISRWADICNALCRWEVTKTQVRNLFGRQAIPMIWDFAEPNVFSDAAGNFSVTLATMVKVIERMSVVSNEGVVQLASATVHPLPSDSADALVTDPPYYNAVPYADLSDFFYVWLKRTLLTVHPELFSTTLTPKDGEVCQMSGWDPDRYAKKDAKWYEVEMGKAMAEARRVLKPDGIGIVVFAHKSTSGWEAQLQAMIDAGWIVTGSWPIDTELGNRLRAQGSAALASSVHIVMRPRENIDGSVRTDEIGDWREVLAELPKRIHSWMPRLADEGVVGADAIFACLGPALEIYSRYSRVEKASGEYVTLKEYLEQVWAAVSKEALNMIFSGADAAGFEEDARLTAMWLWTLATGEQGTEEGEDEPDDEEEAGKSKKTKGGFFLEYDAARKIAQGLGAHLEGPDNLVEVQGDTAVLLPVAARTKYLFGKDSAGAPRGLPKKKDRQLTLNFEEELKQAEEETDNWRGEFKSRAGKTTLDQVHQCMILFAAGRGEAMKRFLVEDGVGRNGLFWKLAQALSALYPASTDEKRWVDGVLARKKGLGF